MRVSRYSLFRSLFPALLCLGCGSVVAVIGQSNATGQADATYFQAWPIDDRIDHTYLIDGESVGWGPLGPHDGLHGPEMGFGRTMRIAGGEYVSIIQVANGGSTLGSAGAYGDWLGDLYYDFVDFTHARLDEISEFTMLDGVLIVHGESNAAYGWESYEENLLLWIERMREDFRNPHLFVVITRLHGKATLGERVVREGQMAVAEADPWAVWVDTDNFPMRDPLHFSSAGQTMLGEAMARAYLELREE